MSTLSDRLRVFTDAGLIPRLPTRWQIHQGTIEMTPYVSSTDATAETWYAGAPFGHPLLRQGLIAARVGVDHFRTGPALGARLDSLCKHLHLTHHQGMPVFDLQVVQTHPDGLAILRARTEELLAGRTRSALRHQRFVRLILPRADAYYRRFLGPDGWIARAERLDFPAPSEEDSAFPPEFFSLVGFMNHCAASFPGARDMPLGRVPAHIAWLASRRFREGRTMGWFARRGPATGGAA